MTTISRLIGVAIAIGVGLHTHNTNASLYSSSSDPFTSEQTATPTDLGPTADDASGRVLASTAFGTGGINDSKSLLNDEWFQGYWSDPTGDATLGLFGATDWDFLAKKDIGGGLSDPLGIGLSLDPDNGEPTMGDWSVDSGAFSGYAALMIVLKAGPTFAAYLYEDSPLPEGGTWATNAFPLKNKPDKFHALSHFSIYGRESSGPPADPIPEPATFVLYALGLTTLGFVLRRQKATQAA